MSIKIYADTASNLFPSLLKEKGLDIHVIKMNLDVGNDVYLCYDENADINEMSKKFYQAVEEGKDIKTSLINPDTFLNEFKDDIDNGNQIICFIMAKGISGTYQSAVLAANEINEKQGKEVVHIVDTATAGLGEGRQAIHAYELVKQGKTFEEIIKEAETYRWKVRSEFTVDDIKYLGKTGRVKPIVAKLASLLKIKILLNGSYESEIAMTGKTIGRTNSIKKLANQCLDYIDRKVPQIIYITHCNALEDANLLKTLLEAGGLKDIEIYPYDLITGSHVGPGCIAMFYVGKDRKFKKDKPAK